MNILPGKLLVIIHRSDDGKVINTYTKPHEVVDLLCHNMDR